MTTGVPVAKFALPVITVLDVNVVGAPYALATNDDNETAIRESKFIDI